MVAGLPNRLAEKFLFYKNPRMKKSPKLKSEPVAGVRSESDGNILRINYEGIVTDRDHEKFIVQPARSIIKKYGRIRCISVFSADFKGWTPEAADSNLKLGQEFMKSCDRLAYVNPSKRKILQMKLAEPVLKCPIRFFNASELDNALAWIKQKS